MGLRPANGDEKRVGAVGWAILSPAFLLRAARRAATGSPVPRGFSGERPA
jgi:hypothetical protein